MENNENKKNNKKRYHRYHNKRKPKKDNQADVNIQEADTNLNLNAAEIQLEDILEEEFFEDEDTPAVQKI